eukprot:XP_001707404.1 Hypothetical protein GL50803_25815 [Giardia lamblia ATCC 50803]
MYWLVLMLTSMSTILMRLDDFFLQTYFQTRTPTIAATTTTIVIEIPATTPELSERVTTSSITSLDKHSTSPAKTGGVHSVHPWIPFQPSTSCVSSHLRHIPSFPDDVVAPAT